MRYLELGLHTPLQHASSGQLVTNEPWMHTRRRLNTHVLLIAQEGTLFIEQGGREYEMKPGNAMILLANEEHGGSRMCEAGLSYYWCHFLPRDNAAVVAGAEAARKMERIRQQAYAFGPPNQILCAEFVACENQSRLVILMKQLLHIANSDTYACCAADYCLSSLMIELARQCAGAYQSEAAQLPGHGQMKRFVEVVEWIRVHRAEAMTASGVADRFGYNADYLSYLFKQNTGLPLIKHIHNTKISEAREKLLSTDMSVRQLSYALGFQDEKYFIRLFRMYEGMSPGKYREAYFRTHKNMN